MLCDLSRLFGELAGSVPEDPASDEGFVFESRTIPCPPALLRTDLVVIRKTTHDYNSWHRADALWLYVDRPTARQLGVFLLACLFHGGEQTTTLMLDHPESDIRRVVAPPRRGTAEIPSGLDLVPATYRYFPTASLKHPWLHVSNVNDLPLLALTNERECVGTDEEWNQRDTIRQESSATGTALLAELLLNAGCSWNEQAEYELEGEAGFRGVAPLSAEIRLFLPGFVGWPFASGLSI